MKLLKLTNTYVITPERIFDLRDSYDFEALERELKRGNEYLQYTKKILERGRLLSVSQGNYIGSRPPYGFNKIKVKDGKKECPTLEENKEEADVVRMIFDMYVNQDMGRAKICNRLEKMGIKPPQGEFWQRTRVASILTNVHYVGKVRWNWRKTVLVVEDSIIKKTRPRKQIGEYLIYDGKHDPIVDEKLFERAQEKASKNPPVKSEVEVRNPFAGILYCQCGKVMVYRQNKARGVVFSPPRLVCSDQHHCHTGSCLYNDILERVCEVLEQCIEDFEIRIENNEGDSVKLHARLIKNLEKKLKDLEVKELAQWELQSHPDESKRMPAHIFKVLNEKLLAEKDEVRQALCNAYDSMPEPINYEERLASFKEALEALKDTGAEAKKKNILLKECIERIEYNREKANRWTDPPIEIDVKLRV